MVAIFKIKRVRVILNFIIALFILLSYYFLDILNLSSEIYRLVFQLYVLIVFLLLAGYSLSINAYLIILLFFISNTTFMYGSVLFNEPDNVRGLFFDPYYFSKDTYIFIIKNLYFNLCGFVFGLFLIEIFAKNNKLSYFEKNHKINKYDEKISTILFYSLSISLTISFIFAYQKISLLFLSTYLESRQYDNLYLTLFSLFFIPFLLLSITLKTDDVQKKKLFYLLFLYAISSSFQGARGAFVVSIIFYIWYSAFFLKKKINIKKGVAYILFFVMSITILSGLRSDNHNIDISLDLGDSIASIAIEQGSSVAHIGYYFDIPAIRNNLSNTPMIFGIFNNFYLLLFDKEAHYLNASSAEYGKTSSILGQRISAITNPILYEDGAGLGGNYIVEEYDFMGFFGVIILTSLYVYILYRSQILLIYSNSKLLRIILLSFIYYSFFMPRLQYFSLGTTQILSIFIVYFFYVIVNNYLRNR